MTKKIRRPGTAKSAVLSKELYSSFGFTEDKQRRSLLKTDLCERLRRHSGQNNLDYTSSLSLSHQFRSFIGWSWSGMIGPVILVGRIPKEHCCTCSRFQVRLDCAVDYISTYDVREQRSDKTYANSTKKPPRVSETFEMSS